MELPDFFSAISDGIETTEEGRKRFVENILPFLSKIYNEGGMVLVMTEPHKYSNVPIGAVYAEMLEALNEEQDPDTEPG